MTRRALTAALLACLLACSLTLGALSPVGAAGAAGAIGAVAERGLKPKKVKKLVTKVLAQQAPTLKVGDSARLGGLAPSAYLTSAQTVTITAPAAGVTTFDKTLPVVAPGTYQASLALTARLSRNTSELFCTLYQEGSTVDLIDAYGEAYEFYRAVNATRTVTVTGRLHVFCRVNGGGTVAAVPADTSYAPAQLTLLRVDAVSSLGASS